MTCFLDKAAPHGFRRDDVEILQINVGKVCNQTCSHCHVDAGPFRTESMTRETAEACIALLDEFPTVHTLDITGGAPELNPNFRWLASEGRRRGLSVIDRCNLTVLLLPEQADLGLFLAKHHVGIVASLPCYLEGNVDKQRGKGVYRQSIEALQLLNRLGYGQGTGLELDLVFNPVGVGLPPAQEGLERDYKGYLKEHYGILFDRLITITNMPISRFERFLHTTGQFGDYMDRLLQAFNPATIPHLMCRNTLSVGWDGYLYDCDFNQMLDMRLGDGKPLRVETISRGQLADLPILTGQHCYGCTAGAGSSCSGALVS